MPTSNSFGEMAHFGVSPAPQLAVPSSLLELAAGVMILSRRLSGLDLKTREAS
ncbi:hypothetical protein [Pseudomonas putida]|uniref:hypothetical protein n=1 Tax=Pseudomonas putida TaxID=303 RepID=UPI00300F17D6